MLQTGEAAGIDKESEGESRLREGGFASNKKEEREDTPLYRDLFRALGLLSRSHTELARRFADFFAEKACEVRGI